MHFLPSYLHDYHVFILLVFMSTCLYVFMSTCLYIISIYLCVYMSSCLHVYMSTCLYVFLPAISNMFFCY